MKSFGKNVNFCLVLILFWSLFLACSESSTNLSGPDSSDDKSSFVAPLSSSSQSSIDSSSYIHLQLPDELPTLTSATWVGHISQKSADQLLSFINFGSGTKLPKARASADLYKIEYKTNLDGEELIASGVVGVPIGLSGEAPWLSFQRWTDPLKKNAPTSAIAEAPIQALKSLTSLGYVMVLTDYIGYGASESVFHPYLIKESTVDNSLDMLVAAKELLNYLDSIPTSDHLYLCGFSQGGWASVAMQEKLENGKNLSSALTIFELKGTVAGAVPFDLMSVFTGILQKNNYYNPYFLAFCMLAFDEYYFLGENLITKVFKAAFASTIPDLFVGELGGEAVNLSLDTNVADLFLADFINEFSSGEAYLKLRTHLQENSIVPWSLKTPLQLYHGKMDLAVDWHQSEKFAQALLDSGSQQEMLQTIFTENDDHVGVVFTSIGSSIAWFDSLESR